MTLRNQLRWGGLWIILTSLLMNGANILVYLGKHTTAIQAVYGIGLTGLILSSTFIHISQARRSGVVGVLAYIVSVLSLAFANVVAFLILAELAGIEGIPQTLEQVTDSVLNLDNYGVIIGLILMGISVARAGVFPRWAGILIALGISLQVPAMYAVNAVGVLYSIFAIGGSIFFAAGLIWIGWTLWSNHFSLDEEPRLSNIDRVWGAPFIMVAALSMIVNAYINSIPDLTLLDGIVNLISVTAMIITIVILHTAQAERAGGVGLAGFLLIHLGSSLLLITAYFIMAQLAGQIETNQALMASWVNIPVGRFGNYMLMLGTFLFGVSAIRAEVFPRWTGWLVTVGLALLLPSQFQSQDYLFTIFWVIGATLEGIGIGWMGWTLLTDKSLVA